MYFVTREERFEASHRLLNYKGKCKNIHGHNYVIRVCLKTARPKNGMVKDFYDLKTDIQKVISKADHSIILSAKDIKYISLFRSYFDTKIYVIKENNTTAENLAKHFFKELKKTSSYIQYVEVQETPGSVARYEN